MIHFGRFSIHWTDPFGGRRTGPLVHVEREIGAVGQERAAAFQNPSATKTAS